mmetsp:Transcript_129269/g.402054  ORF Transcript_129269/g.402054 Transcript_129269/m.402054 type:complete len:221 (-) Transcript_129269:31-693(-)
MEAAAESDGALLRAHLDVAHKFIVVGCDDDVDVLNGLPEAAKYVLGLHLQLKDGAVHLVDEEARPDALRERLPQHRLRLHRAALNAVYHHQCPIRNAEGGGDLGGEVHVPGRVDEVDQVRLRALAIVLIVLEVQRHAGALDGHTALLLVGTRVGEACVAGLLGRDDAGLADERVRERRLPVVDVRNDAHRPDVVGLVHDRADLLASEVRHGYGKICSKSR